MRKRQPSVQVIIYISKSSYFFCFKDLFLTIGNQLQSSYPQMFRFQVFIQLFIQQVHREAPLCAQPSFWGTALTQEGKA